MVFATGRNTMQVTDRQAQPRAQSCGTPSLMNLMDAETGGREGEADGEVSV